MESLSPLGEVNIRVPRGVVVIMIVGVVVASGGCVRFRFRFRFAADIDTDTDTDTDADTVVEEILPPRLLLLGTPTPPAKPLQTLVHNLKHLPPFVPPEPKRHLGKILVERVSVAPHPAHSLSPRSSKDVDVLS